jgi:tetratricopeptide (TPR) repeat protein
LDWPGTERTFLKDDSLLRLNNSILISFLIIDTFSEHAVHLINNSHTMNKNLLLTVICLLFMGCLSAQDCKEGINLLPMYGGLPKCAQQLKSDKEFLATVDSEFKDRKTAAKSYVEFGWKYFYKNDLQTSMMRFNQAWLLDSLNADIYWGFGNLLGRSNQAEASIPFFQKSLKLQPNNAKVYESLAASYGLLFMATQKPASLDKVIEALKNANSLDKSNPRILSQLTSAYSYFYQKDSANKYLRLTDKINPQAINPEVRALLK